MKFKENQNLWQLPEIPILSLLWINDFLKEKQFLVRVNRKNCKTYKSWVDVSQGSMLIPLLFLLYTDTIHGYISNEAKAACYAVEFVVLHAISDITALERAINHNMLGIETWSKNLRLKINPEETKLSVFVQNRQMKQTNLQS